MNYKELTGKSISEGFKIFHKENPHVFAAFEREALAAIRNNRKKISAKLIINWIRWNEYKESSDGNFRINDAFQAYYSRLFVTKHPQYQSRFEFRKLRNEDMPPYMDVGPDGQLSFY